MSRFRNGLRRVMRFARLVRSLGVPVIVMRGHGVGMVVMSRRMRGLGMHMIVMRGHGVRVVLMTVRVMALLVDMSLRRCVMVLGGPMSVVMRRLRVRGLDMFIMAVRLCRGLMLDLVQDGLGLRRRGLGVRVMVRRVRRGRLRRGVRRVLRLVRLVVIAHFGNPTRKNPCLA